LFTEADIILLGFFHPPDIVGQYNAAKLLLMPLPQISQALAMGSLPLFGSINAAQPKWWLKKVFLRLCLINAFLFGFITVVVCTFYNELFVPVKQYRARRVGIANFGFICLGCLICSRA
jgi:O-antigen/teichoic acid export membrane protein